MSIVKGVLIVIGIGGVASLIGIPLQMLAWLTASCVIICLNQNKDS